MPRRPNSEPPELSELWTAHTTTLGVAIYAAVATARVESGNYDMPIEGLRHEQWTKAEEGLVALLNAAATSSDRRVRAASDALDEEFAYTEEE